MRLLLLLLVLAHGLNAIEALAANRAPPPPQQRTGAVSGPPVRDAVTPPTPPAWSRFKAWLVEVSTPKDWLPANEGFLEMPRPKKPPKPAPKPAAAKPKGAPAKTTPPTKRARTRSPARYSTPKRRTTTPLPVRQARSVQEDEEPARFGRRLMSVQDVLKAQPQALDRRTKQDTFQASLSSLGGIFPLSQQDAAAKGVLQLRRRRAVTAQLEQNNRDHQNHQHDHQRDRQDHQRDRQDHQRDRQDHQRDRQDHQRDRQDHQRDRQDHQRDRQDRQHEQQDHQNQNDRNNPHNHGNDDVGDIIGDLHDGGGSGDGSGGGDPDEVVPPSSRGDPGGRAQLPQWPDGREQPADGDTGWLPDVGPGWAPGRPGGRGGGAANPYPWYRDTYLADAERYKADVGGGEWGPAGRDASPGPGGRVSSPDGADYYVGGGPWRQNDARQNI